MLAWCSGLKRVLMCVLGPGFNPRMIHFFSSTNNIIKSLQLLFCIDLYYYFYYSNIGCWGFHLESIFPHGIHMESTWKWDGIHVEDSTWIPCGNSIWNGGIHMESTPFHVEYRWKKITKMGEISAKTYSMWNGQIPCGTTWNPCGIRGQGKDLPPRTVSPSYVRAIGLSPSGLLTLHLVYNPRQE